MWRYDVDAGDVKDSFSSLVVLADAVRHKRNQLAALRPACRTATIWGGLSDSEQ